MPLPLPFLCATATTDLAYLAGKREALQDVLEFIQASLDHPPSALPSGQPSGPLNVARLIDYLCVRRREPPPSRSLRSFSLTSFHSATR